MMRDEIIFKALDDSPVLLTAFLREVRSRSMTRRARRWDVCWRFVSNCQSACGPARGAERALSAVAPPLLRSFVI